MLLPWSKNASMMKVCEHKSGESVTSHKESGLEAGPELPTPWAQIRPLAMHVTCLLCVLHISNVNRSSCCMHCLVIVCHNIYS